MVSQHRKRMGRVGVAPADAGKHAIAHDHIPINCLSLPLAERASTSGANDARRYVTRRDIVTGRVAGFERTDTCPRISDNQIAVLNHDMRRAALCDGRARIGPNTFLARTNRIGTRPHSFNLHITCILCRVSNHALSICITLSLCGFYLPPRLTAFVAANTASLTYQDGVAL